MVMMLLGLSACAGTRAAEKTRDTLPQWFVDPSLHPRYSRGTHLTASASALNPDEARITATVLLLRQLGGIEDTAEDVRVTGGGACEGKIHLEGVHYRPYALSWQLVRMEEGRWGTAYYAFAFLDRAQAASKLRPVFSAAMHRYTRVRDSSLVAPYFAPAREAFSAAAGLALELSSVVGNRAAIDALTEDFVKVQTTRILIENGCARPLGEKTGLSI